MNYLKGMYNLQPIDFLKLNKEKVIEIYNCSDIDTLYYLLPFCEGERKSLCEEVIKLNESELDSQTYIDKKIELLTMFGFKLKLGELYIESEVIK